jgi:hypothetical protein
VGADNLVLASHPATGYDLTGAGLAGLTALTVLSSAPQPPPIAPGVHRTAGHCARGAPAFAHASR